MTDYKVYFGMDVSYSQLCRVPMTSDTIKSFSDAIEEDYIFEMYLDDVRLSGLVGLAVSKNGVEDNNAQDGHYYLPAKLQHHLNKVDWTSYDYYLNTHLHFDIGYNDKDAALGKDHDGDMIASQEKTYLVRNHHEYDHYHLHYRVNQRYR